MDTASDDISIIDFALRKLREDERSTLQVARDSGIKYRWLQKFRNGEVPKPGAHLVEKVARFYGYYEWLKDRAREAA